MDAAKEFGIAGEGRARDSISLHFAEYEVVDEIFSRSGGGLRVG